MLEVKSSYRIRTSTADEIVDVGHDYNERKDVLICSGCCEKTPHTGWLRNDGDLFLTVPEAEKSKVKVPARSPSWFIAGAFSLGVHWWKGARELPGVSFTRSLILFMAVPPWGPNCFPKDRLPTTQSLLGERKWMKWSEVKSLSRVRLFATPWTIDYQAPLSMGSSRQEYWSGLLFPFPGDLPDSGIEPEFPALQTDALPSESPGKWEAI